MRTSKLLKKVMVVSAALLLATAVVPVSGQANAQAATPVAGTDAYSKVQQIFDKVGLKYPLPKVSGSSTVSSPSNVEESNDNALRQPSSVQQPASQPAVKTRDPQPQNAGAKQETNSSWGDRIIATGEKYLGVPYKFGSPSLSTRTFDCSSFVQRVFYENGIKLPRNSRSQAQVGVEVSRNQLQKGDLVFFKLKGREHLGIGHVGIYAGNGKVLHTWGPGGVRYDNMSAGWLDWGFVKATRVNPDTVPSSLLIK